MPHNSCPTRPLHAALYLFLPPSTPSTQTHHAPKYPKLPSPPLTRPPQVRFPIVPDLSAAGDSGKPLVVADPTGPTAQAFLELGAAVVREVSWTLA